MYHPVQLPINPFYITPSWTNQYLRGCTVKTKTSNVQLMLWRWAGTIYVLLPWKESKQQPIMTLKIFHSHWWLNSLLWNAEWHKTNCFLIRAEPKQLSKKEIWGKMTKPIKNVHVEIKDLCVILSTLAVTGCFGVTLEYCIREYFNIQQTLDSPERPGDGGLPVVGKQYHISKHTNEHTCWLLWTENAIMQIMQIMLN